ncbi:MAG: lysine--tRNA ligase [Alphaproteobacteria bacterium]|nr:lysine--tRNA ligase [Alphaproteobacteria bacterium]|tara:strand:+ start:3056 stop:4636 length:1581 start_codon:yes stop_codon:yes gene_type:complete
MEKIISKISANNINAWPFKEAYSLLSRVSQSKQRNEFVLFETGYGPSGLPHIGTFGEVARTSMVKKAFESISDIPTKLIAFSDDMDGLRKVPDNIPNQKEITKHLGKPLTQIPDPFGTHESFGENMNARLKTFLDRFDFNYEFRSATKMYKSGAFDKALTDVLENYEAITKLILPTLGEERRLTYSPFLPICPRSGTVLQVPIVSHDVQAKTITYIDINSEKEIEVPITRGHCKLQWKADWAMRWHALGVDYEMSGKDLIPSVQLSSRICKILGSSPPKNFTYELFLDENGEKISKSKGNGLTIDQWLRYGSKESLSLYMFNSPRKAKRLHFDVIPKHVDEYLRYLDGYEEQKYEDHLENPVWHIHSGEPPGPEEGISYNILLNLANVCNTENPDVLWGFISNYAPTASPKTAPILDQLVKCAINFYKDFVKPNKNYREADDTDRMALKDLAQIFSELPKTTNAEDIQTQIYEIGKKYKYQPLRSWFSALYEILLGQPQGPRMGSFVALYGIDNTVKLIEEALEKK